MRAFSFAIRPPRNPLLRAGLAVGGLLLLGFFAAFAVTVAALVLIAFGARRLLMPARTGTRPLGAAESSAPDASVIDGEYTVVRKPHATLLPR